ncbi:MAG: adenylate kinase [Actinomycetota bacterium]
MTRLLILGPPGAGKGTQAAALAIHADVPAISTGDLFRENIARRTDLGVKVKKILDAGGYVSDEITNSMVRDRLAEEDTQHGFLLDGYPRTRAQVTELDTMLAEVGTKLDAVLELAVGDEELIRRLLRRAKTEGRADDDEAVIRRRQQMYREETVPLVEIYRSRGILHTIDGAGEMADVARRIGDVVDDVIRARQGKTDVDGFGPTMNLHPSA